MRSSAGCCFLLGLTLLSSCTAGESPLPTLGQVEGKDLLAPPGWETDPYSFEHIGKSVTTVGDVDGTGVRHLAVGTLQGPLVFAGTGDASTPSTAFAWHLDDDGSSYDDDPMLSAAGDTNGDGYADFLLSRTPDGDDPGYCLYFGQSGGPSAAGSVCTKLDPNETRQAVAGVGDVNGDTYADIAIGNDFNETVQVHYGAFESGPSRSADAYLNQPEDGASFGSAIAGGGDVNGDGYDDIVVGDPGYDLGRGWAGLFLGGPGGIAADAAQSWEGAAQNDYFGGTIDIRGDFNLDGAADLVIGAYGAENGAGTVSVYLGGATMDTAPSMLLVGDDADEGFGRTLAVLGDTDLDGRPDLVIGAPAATGLRGRPSTEQYGRAEVYAGGDLGVDSTPTQSFLGSSTDGCLGDGMGAAGDFNGDGCADAAIADSCSDNGAVYVYWGYGDKDADGAIICGGGGPQDCDDTDGSIYPGAPELCDGKDNNCNGEIDEPGAEGETRWYADTDGDGYGDPDNSIVSCEQPDGYVADNTDCDDTNEAVNPGAIEICNGIDDDCDGIIDADAAEATTWYVDTDGDGYGDTPVTDCKQPTGTVPEGGDCDDADASVHPGADEVCDDEIDNDCDGLVDSEDDGCIPTKFIWEGGCGCATGAGSTPAGLFAAAAAMLMVRRRGQRQ